MSSIGDPEESETLKAEIARRLEVMSATWRLLELIGLQEALPKNLCADENEILTKWLNANNVQCGVSDCKTD